MPGSTMASMSATSPVGKADTLRGRPDCWSGVGWLLAVTAVCGFSDAFALPDASVWLGMPMTGHEMFRPEWLVAGTLVALPLFRTARASLVLGTIAFLLSAGEMFTIVDNARGRFEHNASLFGGGPDFPPIYYAVAALQVAIFLVATVKGLRMRWADRRFDSMMRKMSAGMTVPQFDRTRRQQVSD